MTVVLRSALAAALLASATLYADDSAGKIVDSEGKIFASAHTQVVRKVFRAGEKIERHNHEGEEVFFTVLHGKVSVTLNDREVHTLNAGDVLQFDGKHFIAADIGEDATVVITLIRQ